MEDVEQSLELTPRLLEGRAQTYEFLSQLFSAEPTSALVERLASLRGQPAPPEMVEGMELLAGLDDGGNPDAFLRDLQWDYTRLFIGIKRLLAPPYESVYTSPEHLVMQQSTREVRGHYGRAGLEIERLYEQPDDHVGLELAFMALLCRQAAAAIEAGESPRCAELLQWQKEFYVRHLSVWLPRFCEDVLKHAETDLFRGAARLLQGFLGLEGEFLESSTRCN
jgi:TorA maturation chaperone TorD